MATLRAAPTPTLAGKGVFAGEEYWGTEGKGDGVTAGDDDVEEDEDGRSDEASGTLRGLAISLASLIIGVLEEVTLLKGDEVWVFDRFVGATLAGLEENAVVGRIAAFLSIDLALVDGARNGPE